MQLSQYKFILCTYQPRDTHPREHILLEGFTVDYVESTAILQEAGGVSVIDRHIVVIIQGKKWSFSLVNWKRREEGAAFHNFQWA